MQRNSLFLFAIKVPCGFHDIKCSLRLRLIGITRYEMKAKRPCEKAVRTTISMPPNLWRDAVQTQQRQRYATFSDLIQELLRKATMPNAAP